MASTMRYAWHREDETGIYRRHMHGIEIVNAEMSHYDGTTSMFTGITVYAKSSSPDTSSTASDFVELLREAWKRLRYEAPILATSTSVSNIDGLDQFEFIYSSPRDTKQVEAWLGDTFHIIKERCARQVALERTVAERNGLIVGSGEGRYTSHIYIYPAEEPENTYHIFLACPHSATDVRGSYTTLHRLFELTTQGAHNDSSDVNWGNEVDRLYPPLVYAAGLRQDGDSPPIDVQQVFRESTANQIHFSPSCQLPIKVDQEPLQAAPFPILTTLTLSPEKHSSITTLGKRNGTSVTGIIAAILGILSVKYNIVSNPKSAVIWGVATDRRARLPKEYLPYYGQCIWSKNVYLEDMDALVVALRGMFEERIVTPDFWKLCTDFKKDVDAFAKDDTSLAISNDLIQAGRIGNGAVFDKAPPAQCFYSSYGKIDNVLRHTYSSSPGKHSTEGQNLVLSISNPSCMALFHNTGVVAFSSSSWQGELKIFSQHSRIFYEQTHINAFYADIATCLEVLASSQAT